MIDYLMWKGAYNLLPWLCNGIQVFGMGLWVLITTIKQNCLILCLQFLVCKSSTLGPLIQYNSAGFLPNVRHHLAMGFAVLDVAQVAHKHWKGGRSSKTNKKMSWREIFDVAVKWRRWGRYIHSFLTIVKKDFLINVMRNCLKNNDGHSFIQVLKLSWAVVEMIKWPWSRW